MIERYVCLYLIFYNLLYYRKMIFPFLLLWILLLLLFRYQLKQNNETALIRSTLFTLIAYIIRDCSLNEGLKNRRKKIKAKKNDINENQYEESQSQTSSSGGFQLTNPSQEYIDNSEQTKYFNKKFKKKRKKACRKLNNNANIMNDSFDEKLLDLRKLPKLSSMLESGDDPTTVYNSKLIDIQNTYNDAFVLHSLKSRCQ